MSPAAPSLQADPHEAHEADTKEACSSLYQKAYVNRATQTDSAPSQSKSVRADEASDNSFVQSLSDKLSDMDISAFSKTSLVENSLETSVVVDDSAYSLEGLSLQSSPPALFSSTTRAFKQDETHVPAKYVRTQKTSVLSTRLLSLPETVSAYSAKKALAKGPRVISNPEHLNRRLRTPENDAHSEQQFDLNEDAAYATHRSAAIDTPHTPSPPSSPDSVVIISNNNHLSESFLRGKAHRPSSSPDIDDDEWSTWTMSPPRPIPALHGPLSLPYARCPSGAEGTIIEEPENLPRMIWGLEGEGSSSSRHRLDTSHTAASLSRRNTSEVSSSPSANAPRGSTQMPVPRQQPLPPRIHSQSDKNEVSRRPQGQQQQVQGVHEHSRPQAASAQHPPIQPTDAFSYEYILPERGPIDLTNLVRPRKDNSRNASNLDLFDSAYGSANYGTSDQLDAGWQSLRLTQERLRNLNLGSLSASTSADDLGSYLVPSSSSTSLSSLSSSRSPIILDPPQATRLHRPVISQQAQPSQPSGPQRRMSALEIAQNYRQQQTLQEWKQHMLPTPPDSTSPLWSSAFSPYQEPSLSPEVLAASHLPNLFPAKTPLLNHAELQQLSRMAEHERANKLRLGAWNGEHIDLSYAPRGVSLENMALYQDLLLANNMDHLSVQQPSPHGTLGRNPSTTPQRSPVPPRPPPNTPASAARRDKHGPMNSSAPPMSPTTNTKHNVQQHPRSIPMSRLIQRRLSAVPEEDSGTLSEHAPTPPPDVERVRGGDKNTLRNARTSSGQGPNQTGGTAVPGMPMAGKIGDGQSSIDDASEKKGKAGSWNRNSRGRPKKNRAPLRNVVKGPERVDGGMTVRS